MNQNPIWERTIVENEIKRRTDAAKLAFPKLSDAEACAEVLKADPSLLQRHRAASGGWNAKAAPPDTGGTALVEAEVMRRARIIQAQIPHLDLAMCIARVLRTEQGRKLLNEHRRAGSFYPRSPKISALPD